MVDRVVFTRGMTVLCERFGRPEPSAALIRGYLEHLDQYLDTSDFQRGARQIFFTDTYFPTPERIVNAAHGGDPVELAADAWRDALDAARAGRYPDLEAQPPEVIAAYRAAPMREIQTANDYQLTELRRAFTEACAAAIRRHRSIAHRLEAGKPDTLPPDGSEQ